MLRRSVDALTGETHRCADCGRAPLIGEALYGFDEGVTVCELCRPLRDGEPDAIQLVRNSEYGNAVRVRRLGPGAKPLSPA